MGFGAYNFSALQAIKGIAFHSLEKYTTAEIVDVGVKVVRLVESFKEQHPNKIVEQRVFGGLLGDGSTYTAQLNNFEIAQKLVATDGSAMHDLAEGAKGLPVLMAYLAVITIGKELPNEYLLESALPYAVRSLSLESHVEKRWSESLEAQIALLAPLASTGLKFKGGRKEEAIGPLRKAIRRRLKAHPHERAKAIWIALKDKPPRGMIFHDNPRGKYIEYDQRTHLGNFKNTEYKRFANTVSEEVKRLRKLTV